MSVLTPTVACAFKGPPAVPSDLIWRLSVDQYHEMIRAGILTDDDPVELLEGWLVCKMPKNPPHRAATRLTRQDLERVVPAGWYVDSQEPVTLQDSEPEPDVMVVRGETRQYLERHPGPQDLALVVEVGDTCHPSLSKRGERGQDLALVVEVGDTTLERDRGSKQRAYARAAIPVYWILSLSGRQLEVYTDPSGPAEQPGYRQHQVHGPADSVPVVITGQEVGRIKVQELLP